MKMPQMHVGAGTTRGALTVFPVWADPSAGARKGYTTRLDQVRVDERPGGAAVPTLRIRNDGTVPAVLFEGQVLEGGWQNRMLVRSIVVPAGGDLDAEVVCVEQGRWHGGDAHAVRNRRASNRVRTALRQPGVDQQCEVWSRISEYDARFGPTATSSFTEQLDRADAELKQMTQGLVPILGQVGVVVAIAGQPVALEVFDDHWTFKSQFASIVQAAALDALGQPVEPTPSRRARRFADRVAAVPAAGRTHAGAGVIFTGRSEYADVSALGFNRHYVHVVATSTRHDLTKVA